MCLWVRGHAASDSVGVLAIILSGYGVMYLRLRDVFTGMEALMLALLQCTTAPFVVGFAGAGAAARLLRPCASVVDVVHEELQHPYEYEPLRG